MSAELHPATISRFPLFEQTLMISLLNSRRLVRLSGAIVLHNPCPVPRVEPLSVGRLLHGILAR